MQAHNVIIRPVVSEKSYALIAQNIEALGKAGYTLKPAQIFDMSLINEVYKENPDLIKA